MQFYSKERQDMFVHYLFKNNNDTKIFLDVGCYHPFDGNNTKALEDQGWEGALFDIREKWTELCKQARESEVFLVDVATPEFVEMIVNKYPNKLVDYISLDVDSGTLKALIGITENNVRFKCMTLEHDSYKEGSTIRDVSREILKQNGYFLLFEDVKTDLTDLGGWQPWEDWWIDPQYFSDAVKDLAGSDLTYNEATMKIMEFSLENDLCI